MPETIEDSPVLYKTQEDILNELAAAMVARIPDVYLGEDGNLRIFFEVFASVLESVFLANQIVSEDMFVQTANAVALERKGDEYGFPIKTGTKATGTLKISGAGGTYIPIGATAAYDPGTGIDPYIFETTEDDTVPNPGIPTAPTPAVGSSGNISGLIEYVITFITASGETLPGTASIALSITSKQVDLTDIPTGGSGTTQRKIYRQKDGEGYKFVHTITDNSATTYTDNIADGSLGGAPPTSNTAQAISMAAASEDVGAAYNVTTGTILQLIDMPDGITGVTNAAPFTGGSDPEDYESYRIRLLDALRSPQTGSPLDIRTWAEAVDGVQTATVTSNDNLGTPTNGHVTVRIVGPGGTVPSSDVITAVEDALEAKDLANVTFHVATFTELSTDVTIVVVLATDYVLADVTDTVTAAVSNYILNLQAGESLRVAGLIDAVFGLPGIADIDSTTPSANQTTDADKKRVPGTITVDEPA